MLLVLAPTRALAEGIAIQHSAVGCVVAERFPRFEARFDPPERLSRARVHFRPEGGRHWYSVAMAREGDVFRAVMPKPKRSLKAFSYYIEATDADFTESRTQDYAPRVVGDPAECQEALMAVGASTASVVVEASAGAPPIPPGFAATGVTTTVGAAAGTVTAAAGGGGGVSLGLVAGVAGGAAVATGVVVAAGHGGNNSSTGQGASSTTPGGTGGGTGTTPPPATIDLTGRWLGIAPDGAEDTAGGCSGQQQDTLIVVAQTGANLSGTYQGTVRVSAPGCAPVGTLILGTLSGTAGSGTLSFNVTFTAPPGLRPTLATGTFTANRMGGTFQNVGGNGGGNWSSNRQ